MATQCVSARARVRLHYVRAHARLLREIVLRTLAWHLSQKHNIMRAQHYWSAPHAYSKRVQSTARLAGHRFIVVRARARRRRDRRRLMQWKRGDGDGEGSAECARARTCSSLITLD